MTATVAFEEGIATSSGVVTVYYFDAVTGEFVSSGDEFVTVGLGIPACACVDAPPIAAEGYVTCRVGPEWVQVADHRGKTVYDIETRQEHVIAVPGDYPERVTLIKPSTIYDQWDGSRWVTNEDARNAAVTASYEAEKSRLHGVASDKIAPLKDASDGGYIEESDKPILIAWQKYRYSLTKVDTSSLPVTFPSAPA